MATLKKKLPATPGIQSVRSKSKLAISGESSPESEEEEIPERVKTDQSDLPTEYWQIQKLIKYIRVRFYFIFKDHKLNLNFHNHRVAIKQPQSYLYVLCVTLI